MLGVTVAFCLSFLLGYLLVCALAPFGNGPLTWLLAPGVGLGLTSVTLFLTLLLVDHADVTVLLGLDVVLLFIAVVLFFRLRTPPAPRPSDIIITPARYVALSFYSAMAIASSLYLTLAATNPHGNWDAWVIWNLRARFFVRSAEDWLNMFTADVVPGHSDYPLLIPTSVARAWVYGDTESTLVPMLIAGMFTLATVVLLFVSIKMFRGTEVAMMAVVVVIASPRFVLVGVAQYADIPLSYFILAVFILVYLRPRYPDSQHSLLVLAGVMAGMAAWTKNEGVLFAAVFVGVRTVAALYQHGVSGLRTEVTYLGLGLAPLLAALLYFKLQLAPESYLFEGDGPSVFDRILDVQRYVTIAGFYLTQTAWFILFGMPLFWWHIRKPPHPPAAPSVHIEALLGMAILGLQFLGYFGIYIITPADLYWQLNASLSRLLLHLWPAFLLTVSLIVFPPTPVRSD